MSFEIAPITAPGALCTLEQVKRRIEATSSARDQLIETLIAIATKTICTRYGRDFVPRVNETRIFEADSHLVSVRGDLVGATTVTVEGVELPDGAWREHLRGPLSDTFAAIVIGASVCLDHESLREFGFVSVEVEGTWGIWAAAEDVDADVNAAAVDTVASWLSKPAQQVSQLVSGTDPRAVSPAPVGTWDIPSSAHRKLEAWKRDLGVW